MTTKDRMLPMGLLVGEAQPRRGASPFVHGIVETVALRTFASAEAEDHVAACQAATRATTHDDRDQAVTVARGHAARLQYLNLMLLMRGGLPIVGPAIRVL